MVRVGLWWSSGGDACYSPILLQSLAYWRHVTPDSAADPRRPASWRLRDSRGSRAARDACSQQQEKGAGVMHRQVVESWDENCDDSEPDVEMLTQLGVSSSQHSMLPDTWFCVGTSGPEQCWTAALVMSARGTSGMSHHGILCR
jgi:hypothetical protein